MNCSYRAKFFALSIIISTSLIAENIEVPQKGVFAPSKLDTTVDNSHRAYNDKFIHDAKIRRLGGFLLTGVIVHQTSRILGHASVWTAAGVMIVGGALSGGPAGASAAYLGALTMVGPASAAVETGSLALGVAASWIPGLP
jgi:hypothetical protein